MIVLMALRKEPQRRYASVEQFSGDIRRYLEGRPVIARSDTFGYRSAKFIRRNLVAVGAAALVAIVLFGAAIFEQRSAARSAQEMSAAESRLKIIEFVSVRQQRELMAALSRLAESQTAPAALETYRAALASAQAFETTHPGLVEAAEFVARASIQLGNADPGQALERFTLARSRLEPLADVYPSEYYASLQGLGRAQFLTRNPLEALATFSRGLQVAEAQYTKSPSVLTRRDLAAANYYVGSVLAYNGENEAATVKLRKAFELYHDLAGGQVNALVDSPAGYRKALAKLATQAAPGLREEIDTRLREFELPIPFLDVKG
jgi:tetratricopeptide (TPR) repeat protein